MPPGPWMSPCSSPCLGPFSWQTSLSGFLWFRVLNLVPHPASPCVFFADWGRKLERDLGLLSFQKGLLVDSPLSLIRAGQYQGQPYQGGQLTTAEAMFTSRAVSLAAGVCPLQWPSLPQAG